MDKEQAIKEVTRLVDEVESLTADFYTCSPYSAELSYLSQKIESTKESIESKLRELIDETRQAGYADGWAEADEAMCWNRSV